MTLHEVKVERSSNEGCVEHEKSSSVETKEGVSRNKKFGDIDEFTSTGPANNRDGIQTVEVSSSQLTGNWITSQADVEEKVPQSAMSKGATNINVTNYSGGCRTMLASKEMNEIEDIPSGAMNEAMKGIVAKCWPNPTDDDECGKKPDTKWYGTGAMESKSVENDEINDLCAEAQERAFTTVYPRVIRGTLSETAKLEVSPAFDIGPGDAKECTENRLIVDENGNSDEFCAGYEGATSAVFNSTNLMTGNKVKNEETKRKEGILTMEDTTAKGEIATASLAEKKSRTTMTSKNATG